jgi:MFS family permease
MTSASDTTKAPRPVLQVVLHAPRPVRTLIFGVFVSRTGSFFATFATLFLTNRHFASRTLPLVLVAIGVSGMAGSLLGGWLADRIGHRATLVSSMLASSAAVAILVLAPTHPMIVIAVCLVALCTQSYTPAASALLILNSEPADRVPTFAFFRLALNVGAALGALIAGQIASRSYTVLFSVESAAYLSCALVIFVGLRESRPEPDPAAAEDAAAELGVEDAVEPLIRVTGRLPVWLLCAALFGIALVYAQSQSTLPLQLIGHGYSTAFYGALLALNGLVVIAFELPISSVTRRLAWAIPIISGTLLMAAGLVTAALVSVTVVVIAGVVVFTVGEMVLAPVANAAVAEISPAGAEARYQGLLATGQSLGFSLGPAIGTSVFAFSHRGLWWATVAAACAFSLGIYGIASLSRRPSRVPAG